MNVDREWRDMYYPLLREKHVNDCVQKLLIFKEFCQNFVSKFLQNSISSLSDETQLFSTKTVLHLQNELFSQETVLSCIPHDVIVCIFSALKLVIYISEIGYTCHDTTFESCDMSNVRDFKEFSWPFTTIQCDIMCDVVFSKVDDDVCYVKDMILRRIIRNVTTKIESFSIQKHIKVCITIHNTSTVWNGTRWMTTMKIQLSHLLNKEESKQLCEPLTQGKNTCTLYEDYYKLVVNNFPGRNFYKKLDNENVYKNENPNLKYIE